MISVITKIEVLSFNTSDEHYQLISGFINSMNVVDLSNEVIDKCIYTRKIYKTRLPDAIIAATAIVFDLILNAKCFRFSKYNGA